MLCASARDLRQQQKQNRCKWCFAFDPLNQNDINYLFAILLPFCVRRSLLYTLHTTHSARIANMLRLYYAIPLRHRHRSSTRVFFPSSPLWFVFEGSNVVGVGLWLPLNWNLRSDNRVGIKQLMWDFQHLLALARIRAECTNDLLAR